MVSQPQADRRLSPLHLGIIAILLVTAAVLALKNSFASDRLQVSGSSTTSSTDLAPDDIPGLLKRVSVHIVIQENEMPHVAVVQDVDTLRKQSPYFYKDAETGDRVLVWTDRVVLYSVSRDRILAVLPVNVSPPSAPTEAAPSSTAAVSTPPEQENPTIEVRNGSKIGGRGKAMADALKGRGFTVLPATDAKHMYGETVVIPVSDRRLPQSQAALLRMTGGTLGSMPDDENPSTADFLILIGASSTPSL